MRRMVFGFGAVQVGASEAIIAGVAAIAGQPWETAVFVGVALAMSSKAIVVRQLRDQGELHAPHGRLAFSVLLFQDVAVVPFLIAVDLDTERAAAGGERVVSGDAGDLDLLQSLGLGRAAGVVVALDQQSETVRLSTSIRIRFPGIPIIARCGSEVGAAALTGAGASQTVAETLATGQELGERRLAALDLTPERQHGATEEVRRTQGAAAARARRAGEGDAEGGATPPRDV